jgi:hypothetical protein
MQSDKSVDEAGAGNEPKADEYVSILSEANTIVNGDRRADYGHPIDHFGRTIGMINSCFADYLKKPLLPHHWSQMISLDKQARCMESPEKRDHWVDIPGYAHCGYLCVEEEKKQGMI